MARMLTLTLAVVLLSGCASLPVDLALYFACKDSGELFALARSDSLDQSRVAEVGRCVGNLKIVGQEKGTGT